MQEYNLITLFESYGIEIAFGGIVAAVASIFLRKKFNLSAKVCLAISFLVAAVITFVGEYFLLSLPAEESVSKAITGGSLAVVLTSFTKKLAFIDGDDIKANLEKLLSSIVLSGELDKVVNEIVEKIKSDSEFNKTSLKEVLRENVNATVDEQTLDMVAEFLLKSLSDKEEKDK